MLGGGTQKELRLSRGLIGLMQVRLPICLLAFWFDRRTFIKRFRTAVKLDTRQADKKQSPLLFKLSPTLHRADIVLWRCWKEPFDAASNYYNGELSPLLLCKLIMRASATSGGIRNVLGEGKNIVRRIALIIDKVCNEFRNSRCFIFPAFDTT